MTAPTLRFDNVSLTLGDGAQRAVALVGINLEIGSGELIAITGRSGSGKSSLLNIAGGLMMTSTGRVEIDGTDLATLTPSGLAAARRRSVGYVFQDLNLLDTLTAAENVSLPLELDGMKPRPARSLAVEALASVEVEPLADRFPDEMSGGQRQRVAIARGLVGDRKLLLADEPTGALDEITAEGVMGVLRNQCDAGATTLMVTHDPSLAGWADRVIRLRDGRIDSISVSPTTTAIP